MASLWLASTLNLKEEMQRSAKPKDKSIEVEFGEDEQLVFEWDEEPDELPLWAHYLLEHSWPEDF